MNWKQKYDKMTFKSVNSLRNIVVQRYIKPWLQFNWLFELTALGHKNKIVMEGIIESSSKVGSFEKHFWIFQELYIWFFFVMDMIHSYNKVCPMSSWFAETRIYGKGIQDQT